MISRIVVACALLLTLAFPAMAQAPDCGKGLEHDGVWSAGKFVKLPVIPFCTIKYTCNMKETRMQDARCKVVYTKPVTTRGACSVGRGAVDECNNCLAPKPDAKCTWKLVKS